MATQQTTVNAVSTSPARDSFVARFGEDQAAALEAAAESHRNGINDTRKGSDPFRWAVAIAIGYECISADGYREAHGITAPWPELREWIKTEARLNEHDGDVDYICLLAGGYNEYMPTEAAEGRTA